MAHTVEYVCSKECGWANATLYDDLQQEESDEPKECPKCKAKVKHLGARPVEKRNDLIRRESS